MNIQKRRTIRRNINLGVFFIVGLSLLTYLTIELRGGFQVGERNEWIAYFGKASTVKEEAEVFVSGMKVGRVTSVALVPDEEIRPGRHVKVTLEIERGLILREDATVNLRARGLLGRSILEIDRGTPNKRAITPDQPLPGLIAGNPFDTLASVVEENRGNVRTFTENLVRLSNKLNTPDNNVGLFLNDDQLYNDLKKIGADVREITDAAKSNKSSFGRLLQDDTLYQRYYAAGESFERSLRQLEGGKTVLGRLIYDQALGERFDNAMQGIESTMASIERGDGTLGKLIHDSRAYDAALATLQTLQRFSSDLEKGEGSLGQLMNDKGELYARVNNIAGNISLMSDDVLAGKGSLGLFLRDDSLYRELQRTFESFRETGEITRENAPLASLVSFTTLFFNVLN